MRRLLVLALTCVVLAAGSGANPTVGQDATPTACPPPTRAEMESIANRYFDVFNTGDTEVFDALLAPDYIHHGAIGPDQDRERHKQRVAITLAGFPDARYTIEDIMVDGDLVLIRHTLRGTQTGEYAGLPPTGTPVEVTGIHIHRVTCGVITETWNEGDALWLYQQIGLVPSTSSSTPLPAQTQAPSTPEGSPASCAGAVAVDSDALLQAWFEDGWERGETASLEGLLADSHLHHWAIGPETTTGAKVVYDRIAAWRAAFPDLGVTVEGTMKDGNLVAAWWTATGTSEGPLLGASPTGASVTFTGINIFRVECGRVVEAWSEMDTLGLFRDLGLAPPATPAS